MAFIPGTFGNDTLVGTHASDFILGINGDDVLSGQDGNDRLNGGDGDDRLLGGNGRDYLKGSDGRDSLNGGDGNDILVADRYDARIDGGTGYDTLELEGHGRFDFKVNLFNVERIEQGRGDAYVTVDENVFQSTDANTLVFDFGSGHNDTLTIAYEGGDLDLDLIGGKIKFGAPGSDLDKTLVLDDVEHLNLLNTDTGAHGNYDHWLV